MSHFALFFAPLLVVTGFCAEPKALLDRDLEKIVAEISPARIEATIRQLAAFGTRHTLSATHDPRLGIGAARAWIQAELERSSRESGGRLLVSLDAFHQAPSPRMPAGGELVNIVATLPGSLAAARDRLYVVSGHYDSRASGPLDATTDAPGADDDGSGTAVVLELARVMAHHEFDATLVFLAVPGEEQGLYGSSHWAEQAQKKGLNIAAMFTNDIVGSTLREDGSHDRSCVRLFAEGVAPLKAPPVEVLEQLRTGGENDFPTRQLARAIQATGAKYVPQLPVRVIWRADRYLRGGDHLPFLERGLAAVRFTEPHEVYAHQHQDVRVEGGVQYGDTADFIDIAYTADVARVNAAALAELARAPAAPRGVEIETVALGNDTTLRWLPSSESSLDHCRIVWRETTAAQWEHAVEAPVGATRCTVRGVSKDNVIFGLEAVDRAGHASPAVYPRPRRAP